MKNSLLFLTVFFFFACRPAPSQQAAASVTVPSSVDTASARNPATAYFDTLGFRLYPTEKGFSLRQLKTGKNYDFPYAWLKPPKGTGTEDNEDGLMQYDSLVTVFPLGENLVGVHLSSYDISTGGSMALAQGLDVFLAVDTVQQKVLPDVLHLGITKQRSKFMGYLDAEYTHFLIRRFPGAPFYSLGTFQEKVYVKRSDELTSVQGPFYEQTPLRWYVFDRKKWQYDPALDKYLPLGPGGELPMISLVMTPVEWAKGEYERRALRGY